MGEEGKRWAVTYTKHVNRKRKVYHDGFVDLIPNTNKLMLYDETGQQLLDSMSLAKHHHLQSGISIQFPSFLVDIGHLHTRTPLNPNTLRKQQQQPLSPSHNIIREFKKNEALKYTIHRTPLTPPTPSFQEWEALYTAQITNKSKKYHDGFLRLLICGSRQTQIVLYDLNKKQLDKRFLKKDEIISEGESMTFDSYLVEIGSSLGGSADDTDVKKQGINRKLTDGREKVAASCGSFGGHPQQDACSDKPVESNLHNLKVDKMDVRRRLPSQTPLRDAYQILSILKKPVAPVAEKNPATQCLPQYSESVQLDDLCKDVEGSLAVPIDPPVALARTKESKDRKVGDEGHITSGECTGNRPEAQHYDLPTPAVNAGNLCNKIEISAYSDHTLPTSTGANFITSLPSANVESEAYQDQRLTSVAETDMPSEELAQDVSTEKCSFKDPGPTKMSNSAEVEHSQPTLDCPSFDLGF